MTVVIVTPLEYSIASMTKTAMLMTMNHVLTDHMRKAPKPLAELGPVRMYSRS